MGKFLFQGSMNSLGIRKWTHTNYQPINSFNTDDYSEVTKRKPNKLLDSLMQYWEILLRILHYIHSNHILLMQDYIH